MTRNRNRTRAIRARMAATGESYTAAARAHDAEQATARPGPLVVPTGPLDQVAIDVINDHLAAGGPRFIPGPPLDTTVPATVPPDDWPDGWTPIGVTTDPSPWPLT